MLLKRDTKILLGIVIYSGANTRNSDKNKLLEQKNLKRKDSSESGSSKNSHSRNKKSRPDQPTNDYFQSNEVTSQSTNQLSWSSNSSSCSLSPNSSPKSGDPVKRTVELVHENDNSDLDSQGR